MPSLFRERPEFTSEGDRIFLGGTFLPLTRGNKNFLVCVLWGPRKMFTPRREDREFLAPFFVCFRGF